MTVVDDLRRPPGLPPLSRPTPERLGLVAARLARLPQLWRQQLRFDPERRHYARIGTTTTYEAWLLTWLPGQSTGLHDHGPSSGAFAVLDGALRETTASTGALSRVATSERHLVTGRVRTFGPDHIHHVAAGRVPAVSLHVYGPALTTMTRYRIEDERLVVEARESAGSDW